MRVRRPVFDRFWRKVDSSGGPDACWPWQGSTAHAFGYGCFRERGRTYTTHRFALHLVTGESLDTKRQALHSCDNPPCCNPAHLRWGSQKENIADAMERGRWSSPPPSKPGRKPSTVGEANPRARTTEADVRAFRSDVDAGMPVAAAARKYGMGKTQAHSIAKRQTWRHVA